MISEQARDKNAAVDYFKGPREFIVLDSNRAQDLLAT